MWVNCMQVEYLTDEPEVDEVESNEKFNYTPNNIETSSSISNIDNNIDYSNNSLVNFDKLKIKMNIVEPYLKEIYKQFTINKEMKNLEINLLNPIEIIKKLKSPEIHKILLINEELSHEFKSLIKYDLINKYINAEDKEKNKILKNYFTEFNDINKLIKKKRNIQKEFSLIKSYEDCKNDIDNNKKFFILYNNKFQDIYPKAREVSIYYFNYNNEPYVFFEKDSKIFKLIQDRNINNNLYILKSDKLNLLKFIKSEMEKNMEINESNKENYINRNIQEYYLINNKWITIRIDKEERQLKQSSRFHKNIKESISPNLMKNNGYLKYPVDFVIIDKEKNKNIIKDLMNDENDNNVFISKLFFVNCQNYIPETYKTIFLNKIYIGLMDLENNNIIYFYLISEKKFKIEFAIQFYEDKIRNEEIEYIRKKGIGKYLSEMKIDFNSNEQICLINFNLDEVGVFFNLKKESENNEIHIWNPFYSRNIKHTIESKYLIGVLLCLINLKPLKNFFLDRNTLINFIKEDTKYTKFFYEIFQDLWNDSENEKTYNLINKFIEEFEKEFNREMFNDIKFLIEFLFLKLHNEQKMDKHNNRIKDSETNLYEIYYNEKDMIKKFFSKNNSIIQELFFLICNYIIVKIMVIMSILLILLWI